MEYEITCPCGKVIPVSEEMAGSWANCECGATVLVPSSFELRAAEVTGNPAPPVADLQSFDQAAPVMQPVTVIITPVEATVTSVRGTRSDRRAQVMVALTTDAVWIQDTRRIRSVPVHGLMIERRGRAIELTRNRGQEAENETLHLGFTSYSEAQRWQEKIQACQSKLGAVAPPDGLYVPEGVVLVQKAPDVPYVPLDRVAFLGRSPDTADRGIQLRAALLGADAVIELKRKKCRDVGWGARQVTGLAVRVADDDALKRLRWKWYAEEVSGLTRGMLLLLVIEASMYFLVTAFLSGKTRWLSATGETTSESIMSAGLALGLVYALPAILVLLLRILRWKELLLPAGLAVLTGTTLRGLVAIATHILAVVAMGNTSAKNWVWLVMDPVDWAFMMIGAILFARALRVARHAGEILPEEAQVVSEARKLWPRGLLAATGVYALLCLGWTGVGRYEESAYLVQDGVDPAREHQALLALNEGMRMPVKGTSEPPRRRSKGRSASGRK